MLLERLYGELQDWQVLKEVQVAQAEEHGTQLLEDGYEPRGHTGTQLKLYSTRPAGQEVHVDWVVVHVRQLTHGRHRLAIPTYPLGQNVRHVLLNRYVADVQEVQFDITLAQV